MNINNFDVSNADGNYNEYTYQVYGAPSGTTETDFTYNVDWYGNFKPGTLSTNFVAPAMAISVSSVPEPSAFALLAAGFVGIGVAAWRKRHR